jgi:hypothetical protein
MHRYRDYGLTPNCELDSVLCGGILPRSTQSASNRNHVVSMRIPHPLVEFHLGRQFMKLVMILALVISATLLLGKGAVAAQPTTTDMNFAIMRNGEQIGTHSIALRQAGAETTVNSATSVIVKILFVTAYHYEHNSTERWIDGHLVSLSSITDDNGTKHKLDLGSKGSGLLLQVDGKSTQVDKNIMPASLWNPAILRQSVALNSADGKLMPIKVVDDGMENMASPARPAHHFTINGIFKQDVWYDEQGKLVHAQFVGTDGSIITYELAPASATGPCSTCQ